MSHFCKITFSSSINVNSVQSKKTNVLGDVENYIFGFDYHLCILFLTTANKLGKDYKYRLCQKIREICQDILTRSPGSSPFFFVLTL